MLSASVDNTIKVWELESGECIKTFLGHEYSVTCIKNVLDYKLISGDASGSIKIWKIETGECLKTIDAHSNFIYKILLISNDKFLTCSNNNEIVEIRMFDLNTYDKLIQKFFRHGDTICGMDKLPNGRIASFFYDGSIRIWDLNTKKCLKILRGHTRQVTSLSVISDDKIISGSHSEIKVWDVESEACLQTLNMGHNLFVKSIVQLSNEQIASCDQDGKIIIWNINDGLTLKTIDAHSDSIFWLAKLSDKKFFSSSSDKSIKLWDLESEVCLKTFEGHTDTVNCLDLLY